MEETCNISGVFLGNCSDVGCKFNVSGKTVRNIWPHSTATELELIEVLKQSTPSMPLKKIQDVVETSCNVNGGTSRSVISRAIISKLLCGPMSWKRMSTRPIVKFSPENINYCEDFPT